jgi:transcriptional regulator with XRE-family HTH domain
LTITETDSDQASIVSTVFPVVDAFRREVAARVREAARRRRTSLNRLADLAGISRSQLARILRGKQDVKLGTLKAIADALSLPTRELIP